MNQDQIGPFLCQNRFQPLDDIAGDIKEILTRFHDVEVIIRLNLKKIEHLIEHLPMLRRHTDQILKLCWVIIQCTDDRRHFYGFRAGAEDGHYFFHASLF